MNTAVYPFAVIGIVALVTWVLRALPFLLFGKKPLPKTMQYLGHVLPPAIMTVLVFYCLRNTSFTSSPYGIPEILSCLVVALLHIRRRNMYLSIIAGTICYMFLIRTGLHFL